MCSGFAVIADMLIPTASPQVVMSGKVTTMLSNFPFIELLYILGEVSLLTH